MDPGVATGLPRAQGVKGVLVATSRSASPMFPVVSLPVAFWWRRWYDERSSPPRDAHAPALSARSGSSRWGGLGHGSEQQDRKDDDDDYFSS